LLVESTGAAYSGEEMMSVTLVNDRFAMDISVVGYEFSDVPDDASDANWLVIRVTLHSMFGEWRWQVEDAGALTWELADCVTWLRTLAAGEGVAAEAFGFSEPDIRFETIRHEDDGQVVGLSVYLMDEFQPPTKVLLPRELNIAHLRFHTPPETLRALADHFANELLRFPQRGERPV
jgi:hypothetical protein